MRFKTMLMVFAVLCLAVGVAVAKTPEKACPYRTTPKDVSVRGYFEGFEAGFPPAGWSTIVTNPGYTWYHNNVSVYEGSYAAAIPWQAGFPQDEHLSFDYYVDSSANDDGLYFWNMGSVYWAANANFTVEVNGTEVYNFLSEVTASWVWTEGIVDLTAYDGMTVTIDFIYAGDDGADHHLDAVQIADFVPPPPPPPNDDCTGVIDLQDQGEADFYVDLCQAAHDFNPGTVNPSCTGYSAGGTDVVYSIYLSAGEVFTASQQGDHDSAIYLLSECEYTGDTCVAGADATLSGDVETITYVAASDGMYYLIIDGYSGCSNTHVWIDNPVATESSSWGSLKSLYR